LPTPAHQLTNEIDEGQKGKEENGKGWGKIDYSFCSHVQPPRQVDLVRGVSVLEAPMRPAFYFFLKYVTASATE
jgi:hypothetical protein